ncbi:hypothetical protein K470DRAFT_265437 [Piedraia hortae CBS 480.64]|uniref:SNF2 N-terminal domain-containing protein n=1 Tax=Piedraia hortae CBS 480.64 TaxID=1314780 RepID=A0A6A7BWV5_9PEZI|nr:hypothetical protein K470DRAFT_265437 [Piedraia hortae CBS 480.64]
MDQPMDSNLEPYHQDGLSFILQHYLRGNHMVLADENGLETPKLVTAFFKWILTKRILRGTCLFVVPKRRISSWRTTLIEKIQGVRCIMPVGKKENRQSIIDRHFSREHPSKSATCDVLLTTCEHAIEDMELLNRFVWEVVVVDEAHLLFHPDTNYFIDFDRLNHFFLLLVTDIPEEITSEGLANLKDFIMPDYAPSCDLSVEEVKRMLLPRFLARTIADVQLSDELSTNVKHVNIPDACIHRCHTFFCNQEEETRDQLVTIAAKLAILILALTHLNEIGLRPLIVSEKCEAIDTLLEHRRIPHMRVLNTTKPHELNEEVQNFKNDTRPSQCCVVPSAEHHILAQRVYLLADSIIFFDTLMSQRSSGLVFEPSVEEGLQKELIVIRLLSMEAVNTLDPPLSVRKKIDLAVQLLQRDPEAIEDDVLADMPMEPDDLPHPRKLLTTDIVIRLAVVNPTLPALPEGQHPLSSFRVLTQSGLDVLAAAAEAVDKRPARASSPLAGPGAVAALRTYSRDRRLPQNNSLERESMRNEKMSRQVPFRIRFLRRRAEAFKREEMRATRKRRREE